MSEHCEKPFRVSNGDNPRLNKPRLQELIWGLIGSLLIGGGAGYGGAAAMLTRVDRNERDIRENTVRSEDVRNEFHAIDSRVSVVEFQVGRFYAEMEKVNLAQQELLREIRKRNTE